MNKIIILILLTILSTVAYSCAETQNNNILDTVITQKIHPTDYMQSRDYKLNYEIIREELVHKLQDNIKNNNCENLLFYLFFVADIADPRYVPLLDKIERQLNNCAGVNLVGYSKFVELKHQSASNIEMLKLLHPKIGVYLLDEISSYVMSRSVSFNDKLKYFKIICENIGYTNYGYSITGMLESLCKENKIQTNLFINKNSSFKNILFYNCDNLAEEAP
jgi:hypothetical protein